MVKTTYPAQWKYINKWSIIAYGLVFVTTLHYTVYFGHLHWKRGKVPRLAYNDFRYMKYAWGERALRDKLLQTPALEIYPDQLNRLYMKNIKHFLSRHRSC